MEEDTKHPEDDIAIHTPCGREKKRRKRRRRCIGPKRKYQYLTPTTRNTEEDCLLAPSTPTSEDAAYEDKNEGNTETETIPDSTPQLRKKKRRKRQSSIGSKRKYHYLKEEVLSPPPSHKKGKIDRKAELPDSALVMEKSCTDSESFMTDEPSSPTVFDCETPGNSFNENCIPKRLHWSDSPYKVSKSPPKNKTHYTFPVGLDHNYNQLPGNTSSTPLDPQTDYRVSHEPDVETPKLEVVMTEDRLFTHTFWMDEKDIVHGAGFCDMPHFFGEVDDSAAAPAPQPCEKVDSDGFSANEFIVILDQPYVYQPYINLDDFVQKHQYTHFCQLQSQVKQQTSGDDPAFEDFSFIKSSGTIKILSMYEAEVKWIVIITPDYNAKISVHGMHVAKSHEVWETLPGTFKTIESIRKLCLRLTSFTVCQGNPDDKFVEMVPVNSGLSFSTENSISAYKERNYGSIHFGSTIRTVKCGILVKKGIRCKCCQQYRGALRKKDHRQKQATENPTTDYLSSRRPNCSLTNSQLKTKLSQLRDHTSRLVLENDKLHRRVANTIRTKGEALNLTDDIEMENMTKEFTPKIEKAFPDEASFQRIFWDQQMRYNRLNKKSGMRWHPSIIKWCLYLRSKSSKAYEVMRQGGISLPSSRTLFDFSNALPAKTGFHPEYIKHLIDQCTELGMYKDEWRSHIGILQDEMKLKEDLVYDRVTGELIGYTDLESMGNELNNLENIVETKSASLAKSVLVLMIRGIATNLKYPLAAFGTTGVTADFLYPIMWQAIKLLEVNCELKVSFITCDGATPNRKYFDLHRLPAHGDDIVYWTPNPYATDGRKIFFISDPPHLVKTVRNCFSNSYSHQKSRMMWKNGKDISWLHIVKLYEEHVEQNIWSTNYKLTRAHIDLTSFSKMKVNLAAQVLSGAVANGLQEHYGENVMETVNLVRMMNDFFDCVNVRSSLEGIKSRNPNLEPFSSPDDPRFSFLVQNFLGFFDEWAASVANRPGVFTAKQRNNMQLSHQTLTGLRMTVKSIVECTKHLLNAGVPFVLTNRFNQDPLEAHFGHHRQKGGANDNPTLYDVRNNLGPMKVIGSLPKGTKRGNVLQADEGIIVNNNKLPRRKPFNGLQM